MKRLNMIEFLSAFNIWELWCLLLKDKSVDILYFSHCPQIPVKKKKTVDAAVNVFTKEYCVCLSQPDISSSSEPQSSIVF